MSHAYSYGMISPSTVHVLRNSAIVPAKLGLSSKLDGNWIHRFIEQHR